MSNTKDDVISRLNEYEAEIKNKNLKPLSSFLVGIVAALSAILFGFDASIAAATGSSVNFTFDLQGKPFLEGLWVGGVPLGALFGAMFGGYVANRFGRRGGLLINAVFFIAAVIVACFAPTFTIFVISRLLMGLAIGNSAVITPMYMAEISPPEYRGRILFMYQLSIVIGILVSFIVGVGVDAVVDNQHIDWRIMISVALIPGIALFFGMLRMPRSPRWLLEKGNPKEAFTVLARMVGVTEARRTFTEIEDAVSKKTKVSFRACFGKFVFPIIMLGFFLQFFQQATGINADMYFGPQIFHSGGFSQKASMWAQVAMGTVNLLATIVSIFLVDKIGRRRLMVFGVSGIVIMLLVQAYLFNLLKQEQMHAKATASVAVATLKVEPKADGQRHVLPNAGAKMANPGNTKEIEVTATSSAKPAAKQSDSSTNAAGVKSGTATLTYLIFISILLYIFFFAISAGPLVWLMISEIFPIRFRGIGMSIAVAANWLVDYFVSQLFPVMLAYMGMASTFLIYAAFTALGLFLAIIFLPETKGVSLETIEENIYAGKRLRDIGQPRKGRD